jgi:hypothetical protein
MGGIDHGSRQKIEDDQWMKEVESPLRGKLAQCGSEGGTRMRPRGVTVPTLQSGLLPLIAASLLLGPVLIFCLHLPLRFTNLFHDQASKAGGVAPFPRR